jgi:methionyl aminopeptidase
MAVFGESIIYKSREEIEIMRQAALVVSRTLGEVAKRLKPGITPAFLDQMAEDYIKSQGAIPGFKGLYGCPSTLLISVNEQVVHGLPTEKPIEEGDIVSVDCGAVYKGYYGDHAYTFEVGAVSEEKRNLCAVTKECLYLGIEACHTGNRIEDIGYAIQQHAEKIHEEPQVPNYGRRGRGKRIQNGLTIAIEPMINMGTYKVKTLEDQWTIVTEDGLPSAHFEHNVAVIDGKAEILSTFDYIYDALKR